MSEDLHRRPLPAKLCLRSRPLRFSLSYPDRTHRCRVRPTFTCAEVRTKLAARGLLPAVRGPRMGPPHVRAVSLR